MLADAIGRPCHFCGVLMRAEDDLALDHTADRRGYRGIAHASCNARDGAIRGNRMRRRTGSGSAFPADL